MKSFFWALHFIKISNLYKWLSHSLPPNPMAAMPRPAKTSIELCKINANIKIFKLNCTIQLMLTTGQESKMVYIRGMSVSTWTILKDFDYQYSIWDGVKIIHGNVWCTVLHVFTIELDWNDTQGKFMWHWCCSLWTVYIIQILIM